MRRATLILGGIAATVASAAPVPAPAGGFREQLGWQFRSPAELQANLNREALRLQLNGGGKGGGAAFGLGGPAVVGTTVGNQTSGTTSYTVNLTGDNNDVTVDGYLNLNTSQQNSGQTSNVGQQRRGEGR